jgi:hypothetical protein
VSRALPHYSSFAHLGGRFFFTTNAICGVLLTGTASDGYSTWTTNFFFPTSTVGTNVQAWNYACYVTQNGQVAYTSPNITNFTLAT